MIESYNARVQRPTNKCTPPSRRNLRGREERFSQTCWAGAVPHTASNARAAILSTVVSPNTLDVSGTGLSTKLVDPQAVFSRSLEEKFKFLRGCEEAQARDTRTQAVIRHFEARRSETTPAKQLQIRW